MQKPNCERENTYKDMRTALKTTNMTPDIKMTIPTTGSVMMKMMVNVVKTVVNDKNAT